MVPQTGEWSCEDCGCQWNYDELPESDVDAEDIPNQIEWMLNILMDDSNDRS